MRSPRDRITKEQPKRSGRYTQLAGTRCDLPTVQNGIKARQTDPADVFPAVAL